MKATEKRKRSRSALVVSRDRTLQDRFAGLSARQLAALWELAARRLRDGEDPHLWFHFCTHRVYSRTIRSLLQRGLIVRGYGYRITADGLLALKRYKVDRFDAFDRSTFVKLDLGRMMGLVLPAGQEQESAQLRSVELAERALPSKDG
jgi:hypothetical protein